MRIPLRQRYDPTSVGDNTTPHYYEIPPGSETLPNLLIRQVIMFRLSNLIYFMKRKEWKEIAKNAYTQKQYPEIGSKLIIPFPMLKCCQCPMPLRDAASQT
ncbi:hypothetical protein AVEN_107910-1 [Araneus ventricosus]|uniref:Uncharacterized protein n=1 Tax=Araneus ventricosus TaxID=182803 RepID=A0A4Y1ZS84_ARAVE|nr:hypothetical protein AVEN_107910-1 [Araneus ventricosus]